MQYLLKRNFKNRP